ncbi:MAG TPA: cytochrome c oxidase subunit 3 family protein [Candidatus Kapabacteria bacterium]|jgi:cytochrome c oxidase subunit 3|nr:cytochrome c oxidase subunit 3 family protein [Candidatus Kapabacteria bacterium]HOQ49688.1 cytochrome c oxidase subunit 3 family protein [Candidatus Kapabacteria bacterium]HPP40417.1 cytochrome c oxidase subunit 3 family protein [Candidatus Kapabacteria bacterium]HPU23951.1 cytochrome c oxidase subunit 3 family protein [Candidatus Kapabacteria bacterium]
MNTNSQNIAHHRDDFGSKMGMWLFLFTELILFGGLFIMYMVYRVEYTEQFHLAAKELNLALGTINTLILLTSSLTMVLSIVAIGRGSKKVSIIYLIATILLALGFMVIKAFEWGAKFSHGLYPGGAELANLSNGEVIFFGMYFVMTGLHALHVLIGVVILSFMLVFLLRDKINKDNFIKLEAGGLYWHLVDLIWIYLFPLFYLLH